MKSYSDHLRDPSWVPNTARRQGRAFTSAQARDEGLSRGQVQRRLASGQWKRVVGAGIRSASDSPQAWMLLNCAALTWPDAVVIGPAAALFHGAPIQVLRTVDVWRSRPGGAPRRGLIPHRVPLDKGEWQEIGLGRISTQPRSFVDALAWLPLDEARDLAAWVFTRRLLTRADLEERLQQRSGMHGNGQLRRLLAETRDGALSVAERRLIGLLRHAGIRGWEANVSVRDAKGIIGVVDLLFEETGLVIEVDGRAVHINRFQEDRSRQNRLIAAGYLVLRFTWQDLTQRPAHTVATIRALLETRLIS